jgi:hypothetical protein
MFSALAKANMGAVYYAFLKAAGGAPILTLPSFCLTTLTVQIDAPDEAYEADETRDQ